MSDLIFNGTDYQAYLQDAYTNSPELVGLDEEGNYYTKYDATPMQTNDAGEFMFLVRASDGQVGYFARLTTINNLGAYTAVLNSPPKREVYDRIYPQGPFTYIDPETGLEVEYYKPEKFGVFAGEL